MAQVPEITLHDSHIIPQLGLGVWQVPDDEAAKAVTTALSAGYRLIDTAAIYGNEQGVGTAIAEAHCARDELFITTKIWNARHGHDEALRAFDESMSKLGLDHLDLLLIHWPTPMKNLYVDTWKAMVKLKEEGRVRSIGVSNFKIPHLERIMDATGVKPVINQIELHPRLQQKDMRDFHKKYAIVTESWSPLGSGRLIEDPVLQAIAAKHGKSTAQVMLRWHVEIGCVVIPKSVTPSRIKENINVFDFKLDADDHQQIESLETGTRFGSDPDLYYLPGVQA